MALIEEGREQEIVQETRLFDEAKGTTFTMRKKEGLADYRYFPEPDLPALQIDESEVEGLQVCFSCHLCMAWLHLRIKLSARACGGAKLCRA